MHHAEHDVGNAAKHVGHDLGTAAKDTGRFLHKHEGQIWDGVKWCVESSTCRRVVATGAETVASMAAL